MPGYVQTAQEDYLKSKCVLWVKILFLSKQFKKYFYTLKVLLDRPISILSHYIIFREENEGRKEGNGNVVHIFGQFQSGGTGFP